MKKLKKSDKTFLNYLEDGFINGVVTLNVLPLPGVLSTDNWPPCTKIGIECPITIIAIT